MDTEFYDDIIIGGGKAGKTLTPALVADGRLVPSCLFIDPELAHVGLTENSQLNVKKLEKKNDSTNRRNS